jgi:hypothetical protein
VEDPFAFEALQIQQPGRVLANRANYEIFAAHRRLVATVAETVGHARLRILLEEMPDARGFTITTAAGELFGSLIYQTNEWVTDLRGPEGELIGQIGIGGTRRVYTLLDEQGTTLGAVNGDLPRKNFTAKDAAGIPFARVRKTRSGLTKSMLTQADHYAVEFTGPVSQPARTLTVMVPIVLDLEVYGPF